MLAANAQGMFAIPGSEHRPDTNGPEAALAAVPPSYCNLNLFHAPLEGGQPPPDDFGYVSADGHHFNCRNPADMLPAFHL